jgi:hypothetical protein
MSYVRSLVGKRLDPEFVKAVAQFYELNIPNEDLDALAISLADQIASLSSLESLDLTENPPILKMDPRWHE